MSYEVIKFIHVLLLVFWLGTDVGVLLLARRFRDASLSVETRLTLLHMAMVIDTLPRICFIVMLPVGVHLANAAGLLNVEMPGLVGLWLLAAVLLTVNMSAAKHIGTPLGARLQRLNWTGLGIAGLLLIATGLASLVNGTPYMVSWLAAKIVIYGLVYWFAIGIDWMFLPVGRLTANWRKRDLRRKSKQALPGRWTKPCGLYWRCMHRPSPQPGSVSRRSISSAGDPGSKYRILGVRVRISPEILL